MCTWCKAPGDVRRDKELAIIAHNAFACNGTSLTPCSSPTFVSNKGIRVTFVFEALLVSKTLENGCEADFIVYCPH